MEIPLSKNDMNKLFNYNINIKKRNKITTNDIKEIINTPLLILYESIKNIGHWVLVFKTLDINNNPIIEFFDSYGIKIDDELKFSYYNIKNMNKLIKRLFKVYKFNIGYNQFKFQSNNTSVCGWYCYLRYVYKDMNIESFNKLLNNYKNKYNISYDNVVYSLSQLKKNSIIF